MTDTSWGMRFNEHPDYQRVPKDQVPSGCPEWLERHQINTWQEQGLIVWNNTDRKIEALSGSDCLRLLHELTSQDKWKSSGISITRLVHRIEFELPPRGRRKKKEPEPEIKTETKKSKPAYEEVLHLPPEAGPQLIKLLEEKKQIVTERAKREKERFDEAIRQFLEWVLESSHMKEMKELDFTTRPFEWRSGDPDIARWTCHFESAEGRVWLDKSKYFWSACVKRDRHGSRGHHSNKFQEAIEWVEKEIMDLANEPELGSEIHSEQKIEADRIRLKEKLVGSPYWIDPARLEPKQVTYRVYIELEAKPISWDTFEDVCGDPVRYAERYLSPAKMADALNIGFDHFSVEQPIGENTDWYQFISLTTYYQEAVAAEQAQKTWNESRILGQFKERKIARARYGYKEVETGFEVFLGDCAEPENPWYQPVPREDFIAEKALRESLVFALDVTDYRDFLGVSTKHFDDERLLLGMHRIRANSKYIPEEVRRESKVWLAEHEPLE